MISLLPGHELGRYELLVPVARGGMAQLWAARLRGTRGFQKIVAIKTLLPEVLEHQSIETMFLEEATLAAQIHHPNVVQTIELAEHQDTLYLVMEWVNGEPLSIICQQATPRGGTPLPVAVNLIGQACRGLHAAHELCDESGTPLGLVHRDVTPQNLLVTYSGKLKLADFGVAKATARVQGHTQAGEVKGKLAYMAPEQITNRPLDRRADVFGMGVVLYLMTTGRHPFKGENPGATVRNICNAEPARPTETVPDYPPALEEAVLKALAKSPEDRWRTAQDLLSALQAAMPGALETAFDERVGEWMQEMFAERAADKLAQVRLAQQLADRGGLPGSQPGVGSGGSFRAVSLEAKHPESTRSLTMAARESLPEISASLAVQSNTGRRKSLALGVVLGLVAAVVFVAGHAASSDGQAAALGSPPQRITSSAQAAPVVPAFAPGATIATPVVAPDEQSAERARAMPQKITAASPAIRAEKSATRSPSRGDVPKPVSNPLAQAPVTPQLERSGHEIDAWNADTFGGRR